MEVAKKACTVQLVVFLSLEPGGLGRFVPRQVGDVQVHNVADSGGGRRIRDISKDQPVVICDRGYRVQGVRVAAKVAVKDLGAIKIKDNLTGELKEAVHQDRLRVGSIAG
jgi:hypothetical protein